MPPPRDLYSATGLTVRELMGEPPPPSPPSRADEFAVVRARENIADSQSIPTGYLCGEWSVVGVTSQNRATSR